MRAGALLAPRIEQKRAVVVTDEIVADLHLQSLLKGLAETGIAASQIVVPAGEASKNLETWQSVVDQLLEARVERRTTVIALGGGVVGDLAGFAAATTLRGLPFVQIPTTLLAQVDFIGGRQDRGEHRARQEPGRRLLSAAHGAGRHRHARDPAAARAARGLCRDRQGRADRRCGVLRLVRGEWRCGGWWRPRGAGRGDQARLCLQGRRGRRRRARGEAERRTRAAEPRPHIRPRAGGGVRLHRRPAARRGRRGGAGAGVPAVGAARPLRGGGCRSRGVARRGDGHAGGAADAEPALLRRRRCSVTCAATRRCATAR